MKKRHLLVTIAGLVLSPCLAFAAESYTLTLKGAVFEPKTLTIPAGEKVKLTIVNANDKPMEFESHELNREKVIPAKGKAVVFVGPLEPGTYGYFDEFQQDVKGSLTVK